MQKMLRTTNIQNQELPKRQKITNVDNDVHKKLH